MLGEGFDELFVNVRIVEENWWMWDAGHVDPVVGGRVQPSLLLFCPVTLGTLLFVGGFTVGG